MALVKEISEEDLFLFLTNWKESQNSGNFQEYSSYYNTNFQGIKRSGKNVTSFDRANWLKDRKGMFAKPMMVSSTDVKIFMDENPYRILFQQGWSNGTYSDVGYKVLKVEGIHNDLKIIYEEMLESTLVSTKNDVNNAFNNRHFFTREGNFVYIPIEFTKSQLSRKEVACLENWEKEPCIDVSYFDINIPEVADTLINKNIFTGNINSNLVHSFTISGWKAISKSLRDSLPGISYSPSIFENDYSWIGGDKMETPLASAIYFDSLDLPVKKGQWAFISSRQPFVYTKSKLSEALREIFSNHLKEDELMYYSMDHYKGESQNFIVSYLAESECGNEFYSDMKLWELRGENLLFLKDLPDLPVSLLDLDGNNQLDILYLNNFKDDPSQFIWWYSPNYAKRGDDTVFLSCGC